MQCDKWYDRMEPGVLWEHEEGVSPCLRKPGKASQNRGHLDCASKACKTERAGREAQAEGASFKKAWDMKGCCDG